MRLERTTVRRGDTNTEAAVPRSPAAALTARLRLGVIPITTIAGFGCLILAAAAQLLGPGSWPGIGLAGLAALLLGLDPRFGPLGGGLIVLLALPYGRAADGPTVQLAGLPVRPADAAVGVAALATLARFRSFRLRDRPALLIVAGLLAIGAMALVLGVALDYDPRDIGRDLRWWALYGALALAVLVGAKREQLLAAFIVAATLFAVVVITASALPVFPGGLKHSALVYDLGLLRMQFGNSPFLLPVIAYFAYAVLHRPRATDVALLALLSGALMLSLTRTSILTAIGVIGLIVIAAYLWPELRGRRPRIRHALLVIVTAAVAGGAALGLDVVATPAKASIPAVPVGPGVAVSPVDRILFQGGSSDLEATVSSESGRFGSYRNAVALIARSPIVGHGLGSLVAVPFAYDANRARTIDMQPGVDDAYLTFAMKGGILAVLAFAVLLAFAIRRVFRDRAERAWLAPAWAAIIVLTITQSFAVSNYGPFALALFVALSIRGYAASSGATAASQV